MLINMEMKQARRLAALVLVICLVVTVMAGDGKYYSPQYGKFSSDGSMLVVTDETKGLLQIVDPAAGKVTGSVELEGAPQGLAWTGKGTVLVAEYDNATVAEVDPKAEKVLRRIDTRMKPYGVAVAEGKGLVVVTNFGRNTVSLIDLASGESKAELAVGRQPFLVAITSDEKTAVVTNVLPVGPATDPDVGSEVSLIDLDTMTVSKSIKLLDGSSNVRDVVVSPDGKWAYVAHTRGRVALPTTQLERGWVNTNAVTIIDVAKGELYSGFLLDTVTRGAADPWNLALSQDGNTLWITSAGAHEVAKVNLGELHNLLAGGYKGEKPSGNLGYAGTPEVFWSEVREKPEENRMKLIHNLGVMYASDLLQRKNVPVRTPRLLALSPDESMLVTAGFFDAQMAVLDPQSMEVKKQFATGDQPEFDDVRRGYALYFDGNRCFQKWLSCSTCHQKARADGLNWDLLNDGIGNPKNSRSMLLSYKTPPVMSRGVRASYEVATNAGFRYIQFNMPGPGEIDAVTAYLRSLEPERSPYLVKNAGGDWELSGKAKKGKDIFESAETGCANCHPAPLFTDLQLHDVGTRHELDQSGTFDNPTLIEIWQTGPWLHDGSAKTMQEVLVEQNAEDKHGKTSQLSEEEIDALAEYLLSL